MTSKYIKVSQYAKLMGLHPLTVNKNFHKGLIDGYQDKNTKTIFILNPEYNNNNLNNFSNKVILYARVSSSSNKPSLDGQIERMRNYASAKGYEIIDEIKEIGSGLNDNRAKLNQIFKRKDFNILLVEHKDRLTRFGFNYIKSLLSNQNINVEVINNIDDKNQEMMDDFISIVTSFCHKIYGKKRKDKTNKIIEDIKNNN